MLTDGNLPKSEYERIIKFSSALSTDFKNGTDGLQHLLSEYFGYRSSIFWKIDQEGNLSNPINHYLSDYLVEDYVSYFYNHDFLHPKKHMDKYRKNMALRLEDVISLNDYDYSVYYKDFMKKYGQYHKMTAAFYSQNKFVGILGLAKPMTEKGFTKVDLQRFRMLVPIISNLLYMETEYAELRQENKILEAFAFKSDTGFILLDENYKVIYMNRAVWDIYRETGVYKNVEGLVEDLTSAMINRLSSSSMLKLLGYKINIIGHQELFLSKVSRFAILIERNNGQSEQRNELLGHLTTREKEVCFYLRKGCTYKEIAEKLSISVNTVNKHIKNIYRKLGVDNRSSLLAQLHINESL
nr:helix-turn-helix transcriptional regulator [Fredinandcohnia onubensis]